jgi:enoyl-[acyl-carrier protein] reductase III
MSLKGKIALVTGGSRGIGRAITLKLASEGADVIINYYRRTSQAEMTAAEVRKIGVKAQIIKANVGDSDKVNDMFQEIEAKFGKLDILINNAASGVPRPALEVDAKAWEWTMDINARAFLLCAQRAVKLMPNGGKMVSISSLGSHMVMCLHVGRVPKASQSIDPLPGNRATPRDFINGVAARR